MKMLAITTAIVSSYDRELLTIAISSIAAFPETMQAYINKPLINVYACWEALPYFWVAYPTINPTIPPGSMIWK
jgi:hypothetical protein